MLERIFKDPSRFDIIHFHIDYLHFPLSRRTTVPHLTTLHGRLNIPDLVPLYHEFREIPVVSISHDQRTPLPWLNFQGTVYHGLPENLLSFHEHRGQYLAFLGRISPEKGIEQAIQIARRVGMEIKIAAKVDPVDQAYYDTVIRPLLDEPGVEYVGEIGDDAKGAFLGHAYALLFPIDWPEPFGLVMIEALACGTPVIAYRRGSVPEVLDDGLTGFIVDNLEGAVQAVERVATLNRRQCRQVFEERFTAARMAREYLAIYRRLIDGRPGAGHR
jgi:glycosyltransferase involved in cell wall biosynthesis